MLDQDGIERRPLYGFRLRRGGGVGHFKQVELVEMNQRLRLNHFVRAN